MKKVVLTVLVMIALGLFAEMHLAHENLLWGYQLGCHDVMTDLLHDAEVQQIDENSLNAFCKNKSMEYVRN